MPRPKIKRKLRFKPTVFTFIPKGLPGENVKEIIIDRDELEAIKLHNYDGLDQINSAEKMAVSQPTFARIIKSAYRKVAKALVEGMAIEINKEE